MSVETPPTTCPSCAAPVPADARFCMNCGHPQSVTDDDAERQARLAGAAPAPLVEKMRAARLTGERKPVTALFADVVGSTSLAEAMDPEDWTQMINEAFELMSQAVFRYEGTIAQLQGDAMLAFFGAPIAHEDDPERAVRAALDMINTTDEFARQLKAAHGIDFRIRVGINSGPVIVGNVGSDLRYEYTALGDAMNVAARVQAAAQPGSVLVTAATRRFIAEVFEFEDLGEVTVKGKAEPIHLFRVVGLRAAPGPRRGLAAVGLSSPLVGRARELEALQQAWAVVQAGRGRIGILIGEPGIGKSRLLAEIRTAINADRPFAWFEGRCVSYGRSVPYHLVLDLLRSTLDLPVGAADADTRARLHQRLVELLPDDVADVEPYFAHLLGLPLEPAEADRTQLDPETLQGRYVAAVKRLFAAHAVAGPICIVLEDIHWADASSVEMVIQLLPHMSPLPILTLLSGRGETDTPGWRLVAQTRAHFGDAVAEVRLHPLNDDDSRTLVANLLEIESLPDGVRSTILARAEGNPFFVEEVIRMFIEHGAIVRAGEKWMANDSISEVEIPATLHGLLLARIDQLPEDAKRSLRVASVIGRQFPVRVLERVLADG